MKNQEKFYKFYDSITKKYSTRICLSPEDFNEFEQACNSVGIQFKVPGDR